MYIFVSMRDIGTKMHKNVANCYTEMLKEKFQH